MYDASFTKTRLNPNVGLVGANGIPIGMCGAVRITNRPGGMCYLCEVLLCQLKVCVANSTKRPHGNFTSTEKCLKRTIAARNEVCTYTKGYVGRPKGTSDV